MKYSKKEFFQLLAILMCTVLLYLTIHELKVALSGSAASAQTNPCTAATPTPSNPPSATPSASPSPSSSSSPSPTPAPSPLPAATVFLTEFMACPESGNEWIELYNASSTTIIVTNWQVIDAANNKKTINGTIPPFSFSTFQWSGSLLNNNGDSFTIQSDSGQVLADAAYSSCSPGISFVYENGEWVGALDSPEQATKVSETTVTTATLSARQTSSSPIEMISSLHEKPFSPNTTITTSNLYQAPSLHTIPAKTQPQSQQNITSQPAKTSYSPAISVILGGILQLATGSYALYETYFKNHV